MADKQKIAILGGGPGGLTTAYWITQTPNWQEKYEVTVYQLGWRLGGKLWNGRNQTVADRDEEHGYHILFGFYDNVFEMMTKVYEAYGRDQDLPISDFYARDPRDEARHPHRYAMHRNSTMFMATEFDNGFKTLRFNFPENQLNPGVGEEVSVLALLENITGWILKFTMDAQRLGVIPYDADNDNDDEIDRLLEQDSNAVFERTLRGMVRVGYGLLHRLRLSDDDTYFRRKITDTVVQIIRIYLRRFWREVQDKIDTDWDAYFHWILLDLMGTTIIGLIEDDVLDQGFDSLNDQNFHEWLTKHAADADGNLVTIRSVVVEYAHTLLFSFANGDTTSPINMPDKPVRGTPNIETGTLLRFALRLALNYKGAVTWTFQADAGDAVVVPVYEVLRREGVQFKFFHNVRGLHLNDAKTAIDSITVERQVDLNAAEYEPLITVNDLPTWPSKPLYAQINPTQAAELQARDIDLESFWTDWQGTDVTLKAGEDFDQVVLGIPVSALPSIAGELIDANSDWKKMVNNIASVRSFAFQTWLNESLEELGWNEGPVLSNSGVDPVNLRANSNQILRDESWKPELNVQTRTYYGGLMPDDPNQPQPPAPGYHATQNEIIHDLAIKFLNDGSEIYWPKAVENGEFRWSLLVDEHNPTATGPARFDSQFWRANINPTNRYIQALQGTGVYRLTSGD
ncbi:MAG: NAD(P)-binding protein [Chloroflexota bacterium]